MRPRDLITFFNFCIAKAVDRPEITKAMLLEAEGDYSRDRRGGSERWAFAEPQFCTGGHTRGSDRGGAVSPDVYFGGQVVGWDAPNRGAGAYE